MMPLIEPESVALILQTLVELAEEPDERAMYVGAAAKVFRLERIEISARQVRTAQRDYFRSRNQEDLIRAKQLEAELDKLLMEDASDG